MQSSFDVYHANTHKKSWAIIIMKSPKCIYSASIKSLGQLLYYSIVWCGCRQSSAAPVLSLCVTTHCSSMYTYYFCTSVLYSIIYIYIYIAPKNKLHYRTSQWPTLYSCTDAGTNEWHFVLCSLQCAVVVYHSTACTPGPAQGSSHVCAMQLL